MHERGGQAQESAKHDLRERAKHDVREPSIREWAKARERAKHEGGLSMRERAKHERERELSMRDRE